MRISNRSPKPSKLAISLSLALFGGCGGPEQAPDAATTVLSDSGSTTEGVSDMSRPRPINMPPKSWLFAEGNSATAGRSETLAAAGPFAPVGQTYPPDSKKIIVWVATPDPGDGVVIGCTAQQGKISDTTDAPNVDVLLTAEWGNQGAQNLAYMKLSNGVAFSVPGNFLKLTAQNLLATTQVSGSAAPYPLRGSDLSAPRYSFSIGVDPAYAQSDLPLFRIVDYYATVANFGVLPPSMRNKTPAPFIIPPYAQAFSLYVVNAVAARTYSVTQVAPGPFPIRRDFFTTDANGVAMLTDIEIVAECSQIIISDTTAANITQGVFTYDFKIGL